MSILPESLATSDDSQPSSPKPTTSGRKKRAAVAQNPEDDHRKRRRNRTTQSCVNCHTSKRMCDRKRPCGRCTQLGLTGLCVYEVDDPNQRNDEQDDKSRLQKRVAELEGVIREMKNKPHPRWAQQPGDASEKWHSRSRTADVGEKDSSVDGSQASSPSSLRAMESWSDSGESSFLLDNASVQPVPPVELYGSMETAAPSPTAYLSSFSTPSPFDVPSPLLTPRDDIQPPQITIALPPEQLPDADMSFASMLPDTYQPSNDMDEGLFGELLDSMFRADAAKESCHHEICSASAQNAGRISGHCGCMTEPTSYNVVLELTLRLRKAANLLGHSVRHGSGSSCVLYRLIAELDAFVATTLGNMAPPLDETSCSAPTSQPRQMASNPLAIAQFHQLLYRPAPTNPAVAAPQSQPSFTNPHPVPSWNDSFTLWAPPR